jgi:hypothetical protein
MKGDINYFRHTPHPHTPHPDTCNPNLTSGSIFVTFAFLKIQGIELTIF